VSQVVDVMSYDKAALRTPIIKIELCQSACEFIYLPEFDC